VAERGDFHPSHDLYVDHDRGFDPHTPMWVCRVCQEAVCRLCDAEPDDELTERCAGFPWHQGITVTVGEDETIRARKSGTGWPRGGVTRRPGPAV
jgi:hypothetical protein